jgi:hypothetical protein
MALTTNLVHLSRSQRPPTTLLTTFISLSSARLATISVGVLPARYGRIDWPAMDEALAASQFASLRRISFTDQFSKKSMVTELARALMPRASARTILD